MTHQELLSKLEQLRKLPHETEWVEFKEANQNLDFRKLGKYVSALSNEANLKNQPCAWLVFGVRDDRSICGSRFRENPADLDSLKHEISQATGGVTFLDIHVVQHLQGRVLMFQIPPAPQGLPVSFQGHWYGRDGESIVPLSLQELEWIRSQTQLEDWSAGLCPEAGIEDLDPQAIAVARANFRAKNQAKPFARDIDSWSDEVLLDRAKLTIGGHLTRTSLLLLGRSESTRFLIPAVAQITWRLEGEEQAYEHFGPPFLLTTSDLYSRVRNTLQKIDVLNRLVPLEVPKYEKWVLLEALHNAIAHQDYARSSRIIVTETADRLRVESAGRFFEGQVSDYTLGEKTPQRYRNRFLADAMVNVNMIDAMGYGIRRMFLEQRKRFYPLPDFDVSDPDRVVVTIHGKVIDPSYTATLMEQRDLPLSTVILLDQVQKRRPIDKEDVQQLRRQKLIEGRYPNLFVAAHIASVTGEKARYIRNRAFDDAHYKQMIVEYIRKYQCASRQEVDALLLDKLSDILSVDQKRSKIHNLLHTLVRRKVIRNKGSRRFPNYVLIPPESSKDLAKESKIRRPPGVA
jgi:ATP-dependent DNA helicase RecG